MKSSAVRINLARVNSFDLSLVCERSTMLQSEYKTIALVFGLVFSDTFFVNPEDERSIKWNYNFRNDETHESGLGKF